MVSVYPGVFFSTGFPSIASCDVVVLSWWFSSGLFSYPGFVLPWVMAYRRSDCFVVYSGRWQVADCLFSCALKQVVIWVNVALSLVLSAFRNSGDLRLLCYRGMVGMGLSLHRFSRVPGESWMVFSCLLGFGGCPNACDKSSGVLGNF